MAMTYGEELLARYEAGARARTARRRTLTLMLPSIVAIGWSTLDLLHARGERLDALAAGGFRTIVDHGMVVAWTVLFVLLPAIGATKRDPLPSGAALAFLAGPLLTPSLFGAGGWKWWQTTIVTLMAVLVLGAALQRRRDR